MRLIKLFTILSLCKKSIEEKLIDNFSMTNNKGEGIKSLPDCSDMNNMEYYIVYDTFSVANTVSCVAIKRDYLISFCNNKVNK